jgi:hypothetical protein
MRRRENGDRGDNTRDGGSEHNNGDRDSHGHESEDYDKTHGHVGTDRSDAVDIRP